MKRFLLMAVALTAAGLLSAQTLSFGTKVGMNAASMVGVDGLSPRFAAVAGVVVEWYVLPLASIQTEALFSMQGARYTYGNTRAEYCYDYFNLPVLAKFYPFDKRFALLVGVQFGYLASPSIRFCREGNDGTLRNTFEFGKGEYNPFEYSIAAGAEYTLWQNIGIELRYTLGMLQIHYGVSTTTAARRYITVPDNRNSVLQIGVVCRFGSSKF